LPGNCQDSNLRLISRASEEIWERLGLRWQGEMGADTAFERGETSLAGGVPDKKRCQPLAPLPPQSKKAAAFMEVTVQLEPSDCVKPTYAPPAPATPARVIDFPPRLHTMVAVRIRVGVFVYRLGHGPLKAERWVRFPYALPLIIRHLQNSAGEVQETKRFKPPHESAVKFHVLAPLRVKRPISQRTQASFFWQSTVARLYKYFVCLCNA